jgi:organic hydroperoxide reductase OsmC/OhrA
MSEHTANIAWKRTSDDFSYDAYSRDHTWSFPSGDVVRASAAPAYLGAENRVDPEEAFVAALSSCHMLTFLAIAARKRMIVDDYSDHAVGFMEKNDGGKLAVTRVVLHPDVRFSGDRIPTDEQLAKMHHLAHQECFIANSVTTRITIEPPQ